MLKWKQNPQDSNDTQNTYGFLRQLVFSANLQDNSGGVTLVTISYRWGHWGSVHWSHFSKPANPQSAWCLNPDLQGFPGQPQCGLSSVYHHRPHPLTNTKIYFPNIHISCLPTFFSREKTKPLGGQRLSISLCPLSWHSCSSCLLGNYTPGYNGYI